MTSATSTISDARDAWDSIAAGYDEYVTPTHLALGGEVVRRAGLGEGSRLLDVAAGSGGLSLPAARLGADVLAIDLAPTMIERLRARAREEGLTRLEARVMDGHALDLADDSFDVAGSQFGVMLFPDMPRALREMVRVTKPGGRVLLVVFGPPTQVGFLTVFLGAMQMVVPGFRGLPTDPPPHEFQAADRSILHERLAGAGLHDIEVDTVSESLAFESGDQLWDWVTNSNPIGARLVAGLSEPERDDVRDALEKLIRDRAGREEAATLTSQVHIGAGVV